MSKKMNNTWLFVILGILVIIFVLTRLVKIPHEQSTLKSDLMQVDTSLVSKILITRGTDKEKTIVFDKKGNSWTVSQGDITAKAQKGAAQSILENLAHVKPQRLVATSKSKWNNYEVSDSTATEITFEGQGGKDLGSILVGKFTFNKPSNPQAAYGRGNYSGSSYVRLPGEKKVYAVEGFLSMMFQRGFDAWRDNTFLTLNKNNITKVSFTYPADSSFVLSYKDSAWYAGNTRADSLKTSAYLNRLSSARGNAFKNGFSPAGEPAYKITIERKGTGPVGVECYVGQDPREFILHSDQNPGVYFKSGKTGLFDRLFIPENYFAGKDGK